MTLTGASSIHSIFHDVVETIIHAMDKLLLGERKQVIYIPIEVGNEFEFKNSFPSLQENGIYFKGRAIEEKMQQGREPEPWDKEGTLAEFSAGSEVANLRNFFIMNDRKSRGRAKKETSENEVRALALPMEREKVYLPDKYETVDRDIYLTYMLKARQTSHCYHRRALGAGGRPQWKPVPISTYLVEGGDLSVDMFMDRFVEAKRLLADLDKNGLIELGTRVKTEEAETAKPALEPTKKIRKKALPSPSDLRRYTVNAHPALSRAMSLMDLAGNGDEVRRLMMESAPEIACEFERITGRKVIGISIHFDSNLPHWNLWHTGLEPVIYHVGKSKRTRYRRTAMNLNASGNMLAWDRVKSSFARIGEDFEKISQLTCGELKKAETRAFERQGRAPGDFSINRFADKILEKSLMELGRTQELDRGFQEFCDNERARFAAGVAGPNPRKLARDYEDLTRALNPAEKETLTEAANRVVKERDQLIKSLADKPTEIIREVIPDDLKGVREACKEIPEGAWGWSAGEIIQGISEALSLSTKEIKASKAENLVLKEENEGLKGALKREIAKTEKYISQFSELIKAFGEGPNEVAFLLSSVAESLNLPIPKMVTNMASKSNRAKGLQIE